MFGLFGVLGLICLIGVLGLCLLGIGIDLLDLRLLFIVSLLLDGFCLSFLGCLFQLVLVCCICLLTWFDFGLLAGF